MDLSDKLLSFHEKLVQFFEQHLKTILGLLVIFIIIGLLWGGFAYYNSKKEKEASLKLMEVAKSSNIIQALKEVKENIKELKLVYKHLFFYWIIISNKKIIKKCKNL